MRIGDKYIENTKTWNHEFSHIASFDKSLSSTWDGGPFLDSKGRLLEEYNAIANTILFPETPDQGYGSLTLMGYLYFLGDGKELTQAYFEHDYNKFLGAFSSSIITREELSFLIDYQNFSLKLNKCDQEQLRFFEILKNSYIKKLISLPLSLEEYSIYAQYYNQFQTQYFYETLGIRDYPIIDMYQELENILGTNLPRIENKIKMSNISFLEDSDFLTLENVTYSNSKVKVLKKGKSHAREFF